MSNTISILFVVPLHYILGWQFLLKSLRSCMPHNQPSPPCILPKPRIVLMKLRRPPRTGSQIVHLAVKIFLTNPSQPVIALSNIVELAAHHLKASYILSQLLL